MIDAGYSLCRRCGHTTKDRFYYHGGFPSWVQLIRTPFGKYKVIPYEPNNGTPKHNSVRLASHIGNEPLQKIEVYCDGGHTRSTFVHSCPNCSGQESVYPMVCGMGELPTYVVGVIGSRSVGKSSWISAVTTLANIGAANYGEGRKYKLDAYEYTPDFIDAVPTPLGHEGKTTIVRIRKNKEGVDEAGRLVTSTVDVSQVLLLDVPGEVFDVNKKEEFEKIAHLFRGAEGYSGVDGIIFMIDYDKTDSNFSIENTYNYVNGESRVLNKHPVGIVYNKMDLLMGKEISKRLLTVGVNTVKVPLFTAETFKNQSQSMYLKKNIVPRVALETSLVSKIEPAVSALAHNTACAGFLIKTGSPVIRKERQDIGGSIVIKEVPKTNLSSSINVMDPLLWMLNKLDIFPIE